MPHPSPSLNPRPFLFGLAAGGLAVAAFLVAGAARLALDLPVASGMAALMLAGIALTCRAAAWTRAPRPLPAAALGTVAVAPALFLGAAHAISDPVVTSHWRCGTGEIALVMVAPFVFGMAGVLGGLIALPLVGCERRRADAALRALALGALALSAALLAWSFARAAQYPDPDRYAASLPVVATVPPVAGTPVKDLPLPGASDMIPHQQIYRDRVGGFDLEIERVCTGDACGFSLLRAGTANPDVEHPGGYHSGGALRSDEIRLKRDEAHDLWIASAGSTVAYQGSALKLTDVQVRDVGDHLSPPRGWMAGAAAGLLLASLFQCLRCRAAARRDRLTAARAGVVGEGGWIAFDDDAPPLRAAPDLGLSPGPVLVLGHQPQKAPEGAYRGEAPLGPGAVIAGDRAELLARVRGDLAALDALTLAAATLTAAPLVATILALTA